MRLPGTQTHPAELCLAVLVSAHHVVAPPILLDGHVALGAFLQRRGILWDRGAQPQETRNLKTLRQPTLVFAAIQLEVSLSSSHFLIHFLNHCGRKLRERKGLQWVKHRSFLRDHWRANMSAKSTEEVPRSTAGESYKDRPSIQTRFSLRRSQGILAGCHNAACISDKHPPVAGCQIFEGGDG